MDNPTFPYQNEASIALSRLMRTTATQSNLILDPNRKTYFMINIMTIIFPSLEAELNRVLSKMNVILTQNKINEEEKQNLLEIKGKLDEWIKLYSYSESVIAQNDAALVTYLQDKELYAAKAIEHINMQLNAITNSTLPIARYDEMTGHVMASIDVLATIYTKLAQQLNMDLQQRIDDYELYRMKMLFALATALAISLAIFIYARKIKMDQVEVEKASCTNAILSTVADAIITISPCRVIENFNHSAELVFGFQSPEVIGKNINILMQEAYHFTNEHYWQQLNIEEKQEGTKSCNEVIGRRKDGSLFAIDLAVGTFLTRGKQMLVASIHDITERKKEEHIKNEFISIVSHELRTPITSIRGSLSLILGTHAIELPLKVKTLLNVAHTNCERLIHLINDILDIDKMASGRMVFNLQTVRLADVTQQAIDANMAYVQKFGAQIKLKPIPAEFKINVDSSRYVQVLSNLLSNSAKFSRPGGVIEVFSTQEEGAIRISVKDYGCGFPATFYSRIFGKFSQADSSVSRAKGGSGLGLNISKQMVEQMNGTIGFATEVNRGSVFWIEFPRG